MAALPAAQLAALFSSTPGWAVAAVEPVLQNGFVAGSQLLVRATLGPQVPHTGSVDIKAPSGDRRGPGTGRCRFQVVVPPAPCLPPLAALQAASAAVEAARQQAARLGFGVAC